MEKKIIQLVLLFVIVTQVVGANNTIRVLIPRTNEKAYAIAGEAFADMWEKVTSERPSIMYMETDEKELPNANVVLIGSDAVNPIVHELIRVGTIDGLGLQYGGDNYRLLSISNQGNNCLIVAGGSGRSTIYAVYDFFRQQAGVEYFWDGDVIPHQESIDISGINILEKPRFEYRGLRYFAHRGLHRFQAEHWDLDDWKKEIDWLMKKRFNLFMLRTGIDDLFQRAFPDDVPYPPVDEQDPDAEQRSYNDRTSFWPLKYRGELREKVLEYARDRGLLHPEDVGAITHWYSHTPLSFLNDKPDFPLMGTGKGNYSFRKHGIWDIEYQVSWDAYWKLTETHIKEFGGGLPRMFHTIGLAERMFGSGRDNYQRKLYVYRKTQNMFRDQYPDVPLLIASWDFLDRWKNEDVQSLLEEFDPERTIILDYTSDNISAVSYRDWGMYKKFPWIFGLIHSFANNSDIHGNYDDIITPRLKEASSDSLCVGFVIWSETSHSDTYLLEYLADNSWQPERVEAEQATQRYCKSRYPSEAVNEMNSLWNSFLTLSQCNNWGRTGGTVREPQFRILGSTELINLTPDRIDDLNFDLQRLPPGLTESVKVLGKLAEMTEDYYKNTLWQRDAIDMARTIVSNALYLSLAKGAVQMDAWRQDKADVSEIRTYSKISKELLATLSDLLAMSDDFSMYASLQRLYDAKPIEGMPPMVNPHAEQILKANAENNYCRSHHYELVEHVYRPELEVYWNWALKQIQSGNRSEWKRPQEFAEQEKIIEDRFYERPLKEMAPVKTRNAKKHGSNIASTGKAGK
jgi:hypothetical protein